MFAEKKQTDLKHLEKIARTKSTVQINNFIRVLGSARDSCLINYYSVINFLSRVKRVQCFPLPRTFVKLSRVVLEV